MFPFSFLHAFSFSSPFSLLCVVPAMRDSPPLARGDRFAVSLDPPPLEREELDRAHLVNMPSLSVGDV